MSGVLVSDVYYCDDCEYDGRCPGHAVSLEFRGSSETYELRLDEHNRVWFTRSELEALMRMAASISRNHSSAVQIPQPAQAVDLVHEVAMADLRATLLRISASQPGDDPAGLARDALVLIDSQACRPT